MTLMVGALEKKGVLQLMDHLELIIIIKISVICTRRIFKCDLIELICNHIKPFPTNLMAIPVRNQEKALTLHMLKKVILYFKLFSLFVSICNKAEVNP